MNLPALARRLSTRDARALWFAALVLAPVMAYSTVIGPVIVSMQRLRAQVEQERDRYRREADLIMRRSGLDAAARHRAVSLSGLSDRLFAGPDSLTAAADVVSYATELAGATGVVIRASETAVSTAAHGLVRLHVELRAEGDVIALLDWLDALEYGEKLVRVSHLSVTPPQQPGAAVDGPDILGIYLAIEGFALFRDASGEPAAKADQGA